MALPVYETFGGSESPLADVWSSADTSGGFWGGAIAEGSGAGQSVTADIASGSWYDSETFGADQYALLTVLTTGLNSNTGVILRYVSAGNVGDCYIAYVVLRAGTQRLYCQIVDESAGTATSILGAAYVGVAFATNDIFKAQVEGTTFKFFKNGSTALGNAGGYTNSSITAAGPAGIYLYRVGGETTGQCDDWEAGNLGAAPATAIPVFMNYYRRRRD